MFFALSVVFRRSSSGANDRQGPLPPKARRPQSYTAGPRAARLRRPKKPRNFPSVFSGTLATRSWAAENGQPAARRCRTGHDPVSGDILGDLEHAPCPADLRGPDRLRSVARVAVRAADAKVSGPDDPDFKIQGEYSGSGKSAEGATR